MLHEKTQYRPAELEYIEAMKQFGPAFVGQFLPQLGIAAENLIVYPNADSLTRSLTPGWGVFHRGASEYVAANAVYCFAVTPIAQRAFRSRESLIDGSLRGIYLRKAWGSSVVDARKLVCLLLYGKDEKTALTATRQALETRLGSALTAFDNPYGQKRPNVPETLNMQEVVFQELGLATGSRETKDRIDCNTHIFLCDFSGMRIDPLSFW